MIVDSTLEGQGTTPKGRQARNRLRRTGGWQFFPHGKESSGTTVNLISDEEPSASSTDSLTELQATPFREDSGAACRAQTRERTRTATPPPTIQPTVRQLVEPTAQQKQRLREFGAQSVHQPPSALGRGGEEGESPAVGSTQVQEVEDKPECEPTPEPSSDPDDFD
jgi:hypothetical protein